MPKTHDLDDLDRQLLALLMENAKRPYTDLAKQLFVSGGTIHVRMNKLIETGVVKGQTLVIDPAALGYDITSFLGVYLQQSSLYEEVSANLRKIPEIVAAHYTTGVYSIFIKVICRDTDHLRKVLQQIQEVDGIQRTETFLALEESINRPLQVLTNQELEELQGRVYKE